jgi:hypothetical protein
MRKSRKYKGGDYSTNSQPNSSTNGIFNFLSNAWNDTKKNSKGFFDGLMGKNTTPNTSTYSSTSSNYNYSNPSIPSSTSITPTQSYNASVMNHRNLNNIYGGKKSKKRRGGNHAHVYNSRVARPTYWIHGGKTKKRKNRRKRRIN